MSLYGNYVEEIREPGDEAKYSLIYSAGSGLAISKDASSWVSLQPCGSNVRLWPATWQCLLEGGK